MVGIGSLDARCRARASFLAEGKVGVGQCLEEPHVFIPATYLFTTVAANVRR